MRAATECDQGWLIRLDAEIFGPDAWSESLWARTLETSWCVVEPEIGYAVTRTVADIADLDRIAVAAERRQRGLAHKLLAAALDQAAAMGARRMLLEVSADNVAARALYGSAGFAEIDRRPGYYRSGADALVLVREVPSDV